MMASRRQMLVPGHREGQRVVFPVFRERIEGDAVLRFHLVPQARAGQGRQKQRVEIVHAVLAGHLGDTFADARFVYVQTDDKGTHDQDVVPLYAPHGGAEVPALQQVEFLAEFPKPFRRGGFKADEDASAPGLRGQRQEFFVIGEVDGGLGNPFLSQVRLCHGAEQVLGAGDVFRARADEVVVHHQNTFLTDRLEFPHDIRNGPLPVVGPVERRHAAEAAVQRTAACGLNGSEGISRRPANHGGRAGHR